jgi:hypothetical protein
MATIRSQKSITTPTYQCSPGDSGITLRLIGTTPPSWPTTQSVRTPAMSAQHHLNVAGKTNVSEGFARTEIPNRAGQSKLARVVGCLLTRRHQVKLGHAASCGDKTYTQHFMMARLGSASRGGAVVRLHPKDARPLTTLGPVDG